MIYEKIDDLIGNTPLLKISEDIHGIPNLVLYAKLEMMNAFGSIKDRVAKNMLKDDLQDIIKNKKTVIESSSGNTSKALSVLCAMHSVPFKTVSNRIKVDEVRDVLKSLGADLIELPGHSECPDPTSLDSPQMFIDKLISKSPEKYYYTNQYLNELNISAHTQTGKEIHQDLGDVDFVFSNLGTSGSSRGIGEYLRGAQKKPVKLIGVMTSGSDFVPGGRNESELFETGFFKRDFYDLLLKDSSNNALRGMRELNLKAGILCGPTSGLVYFALKKFFEKNPLSSKAVAVFVVCDRLEPYVNFVKKQLNNQGSSVNIGDAVEFDVKSINFKDINFESDLLIDIRSSFSFSLKHISGSINIPESFLIDLLKEGNPFPKKRIVVICARGVKSKKIVHLLNEKNYVAVNLKDGLLNIGDDKLNINS